ncbi:MAG TPA: thermonuclease family protein [Pirellulales bacterium]|nr:thermonuclease family protein [Pirellulales bacterium]
MRFTCALDRRARRIILAGLVLLVGLRLWQTRGSDAPESLAEGTYDVQRVVDGDTLLLTCGARVRLMGVNTPETVKRGSAVEAFGPEATRFTRDFVAAGGDFVASNKVRLVLDHERIDRYGRFLAYVWVGDRMLNEELLRAGLARYEPHFYYGPSIKTRYRKAQDEARAARRGIWSEPKATGSGLQATASSGGNARSP